MVKRLRNTVKEALGRTLSQVLPRRLAWAASGDSQRILRLVDQVDVVSFDVFDTALVRPLVAPTHLFWLLGRELTDFRGLRLSAEKEARRRALARGIPEVTLAEIYAVIGETDKNAGQLAQAEIDLELAVCRAQPWMHGLYEQIWQFGKAVVFTSDSYLPRVTVERLLQSCGYSGFEQLFVSSEFKQTKWQGSLFKQVAETLRVAPDRILHIGDTFRPDVWQALRAGFRAAHVRRPIDEFLHHAPKPMAIDTLGHSLIVGLMAHRQPWDVGYHVLGPLYASIGRDPDDKLDLKELKLEHLAPLVADHKPGARTFLADLQPFYQLDPRLVIPSQFAQGLVTSGNPMLTAGVTRGGHTRLFDRMQEEIAPNFFKHELAERIFHRGR